MNHMKAVPLLPKTIVIFSEVGGFGSGIIGHRATVSDNGSFPQVASSVAVKLELVVGSAVVLAFS